MLTTAELACKGLKLKPVGKRWSGDTPLTCAMEGRAINPGDWVCPFVPGPNFMSDAGLAARSPVISGWVEPLTKRDTMSKLQRAVITAKAVYPIHQRIHRAYFLLNPPSPPFACVISDATMQHLIWMAPTNWNQAQYKILLGSRLLTIRQEKLMNAVDEWKGADCWPWLSNDWGMHDVSNRLLRPELSDSQYASLAELTLGEFWALGVVLPALTAKKEKERPQKPNPIYL